LPEINYASAYDKMPGIGPHPKGIHHWWARLPLPTARAVLFASVVDDPSSHQEKFATEEAQNAERERLFDIVRELMQKKLHERPDVYAKAREEMLKYTDGKLPPVFDPFSGGGSIPLEAARLGFEAHAADLNPVAVLLNKCNLELVPRWLDRPPINPEVRGNALRKTGWTGAGGLAEDVRYYGNLIRERAIAKIGHLYPKVKLPKEYGGREANVIAWIWARTVASPNPAAQGAHVPLVSTYWLSTKKGSEAWLEPVVDTKTNSWRFDLKHEAPRDKAIIKNGTKLGRASFRCLLTNQPIEYQYLRDQANKRKLGRTLLCAIADLGRGKIYVGVNREHQDLGEADLAQWRPDELVTTPCHDVDRLPMYGMPSWADAFTPRQLTAMVSLSDLVKGSRQNVVADAREAGYSDAEAEDYAKAVTTFLALALDRCAAFNNSLCRWNGNQTVFVFARHAIPMLWDLSEANILGEKAVCWKTAVDITSDSIERIPGGNCGLGVADQIDAAGAWNDVREVLVSTDPPYYDNIGYAALSDFYYVWLRRTIGDLYPDLFKTILVPKAPELTAASERFDGNKGDAKEHFESGFRKAFATLREKTDSRFPLTVYYAFKQEDEEAGNEEQENSNGQSVDLTTGWETLLDALLGSGFQITATWPVRCSFKWRMVAMGTNALASYIVLACRPRSANAPQCSRREFLNEMKKGTPDRTQTPPAGQYRSGGPGSSRHRTRAWGRVLSLRKCRRIERQRHDGAHRSRPDQPDPR